jgi:hypothetical protein
MIKFRDKHNYFALLLVAAGILMLQAGAGGAFQNFDISKRPVFRIGDRTTDNVIINELLTVKGSQGNLIQETKKIYRLDITCEVAALQGAGRIEVINAHVALMRMTETNAVPGPGAKARRVITTKEMRFKLRRRGLRFFVDPSSHTGRLPATRNQEEVFAYFFEDGITFPGFPEDDALLLPGGRVNPGQTWNVGRRELDIWERETGVLKDLNGRVISAVLRLDQHDGRFARISGRITAQGTVEGMSFNVPVDISTAIETATGRWHSQNVAINARFTRQGVTATIQSDLTSKITFH